MKEAYGTDCGNCNYGKNSGCKGGEASNGCPFGKQCFVHSYIKARGIEAYKQFKNTLIWEFNKLNIPGMPEIKELYEMNGAYVNIAYPMPNGKNIRMLDDNEIYLCNQAESEFGEGELKRCFGLVAGMDFLMVAEYGANCSDPELIIYAKR